MPWWAQMVITIISIIFAGGTGYGGARLHNYKKSKKGVDLVSKVEFEELKKQVTDIDKNVSKINGKLDIVVKLITEKEGK